MLETFKYADTVSAVGRNGYIKQSGIEVLYSEDHKLITLTPLTSKGVTGNCYLEIPLGSLDEVRRMFTTIVMEARGKEVEQRRKIEEAKAVLKEAGYVQVYWSAIDIRDKYPQLSEPQVQQIVDEIAKYHQADVGVNWETIDALVQLVDLD